MHSDRYTVSRQGGAGSMQAIKNKIRSRRGASLTFALLLFLVCAVVGSVVLVAGTAVSGRLEELAESEQRFYAVNSAAELIVCQLCGEDNKVTISAKKNADGTYVNTLPEETLASDLATYLVFGTMSVDENGTEAQYNAIPAYKADPPTDSVEFEVKVNNMPDVLVTAKFINGYQLNLTVKNTVEEGNEEGKTEDQYILPTIILETDNPSGENVGTVKEYTFNWRTPKG